ncbi:MAG TPA: hypothetical protein VJ302_08925 [Blastocatellia bacterium]|nr:hypothetical protein [Blastocatellia bacterium]
MNTKLLSPILTIVWLSILGAVIPAQTPEITPKPVIYTTAPKLVIAKLKQGDQEVYEVRGKATFTIAAANSDDTIAGIFTYTIPDDTRQKISTLSGKPLNTVTASLTRKDLFAAFQKGAAAPVIHLEIAPLETEINGVKMVFNRIVLDLNGREGGGAVIPQYTKEEMEALFTVWAKQINNHRARRGIIARINKIINGEPE